MKKYFLLLIILPFISLLSCDKDDDSYSEQLNKDIELIKDYLSENGIEAQYTESGLHYIIEEQGTGNYPQLSSIVKVKYTGRLLNGDIFDEGIVNDNPLFIYIEGWKEGLQLFKEGGKGTLFIPSGLGYGSENKTNIPPNSVLIFDIELINVFN